MFGHVKDNVVRYAKSLRKSGATIWRGGVAGEPADFALYTCCVASSAIHEEGLKECALTNS